MEGRPKTIAETLLERARRLGPSDEGYPPALRAAAADAPTLWVAGELPERCVTVVGTRHPDLGGLQAARELGRGLAAAGWAVVSGGAVGCDTAAHQGALEAGGRTVVVLGSGLLRPYPRENLELLLRAAGAGAVLSPFPPETEPLPALFHRRNRVLAALGAATVVVRAGKRSGALSTADHARRLGRPLLAVPGSTTCSVAEGSNLLLRGGCPVALDASDVLRAIEGAARGRAVERSSGRAVAGKEPAGPAPDVGYAPAASDSASGRAVGRPSGRGEVLGDPLLDLLGGGEAAGADELAEASGLGAAEIVARLGRLEIEGHVTRAADGRFRAALERN
ncbi:MAG: DNA-protecting protein DprA [Deltaproteobacteria bacterium]|nr:DNA-protecting protein DprA [Deltaproteobacteria bacterium]